MRKRFWLPTGLACGLLLFVGAAKWQGYFSKPHANVTVASNEERDDEEENEIEESKQKLQFIEDEFKQEFDKTKDPNTNTVPRERLLQASEAARSIRLSSAGQRAIQGISWQERGPSVVGGRTRALIWDRRDATNNTVFAGGVAGGLWKGTNMSAPPPSTPTWTKLNDVLDNIAISCLVQDPNNNNTLYAGTGETWGNLDAQRGLGIWKSTDGGANWKELPSTNNSDFYYTQKIVINSAGNVFAATSAGLKKSTDGGVTWTNVLSGNFADLEIAANGDLYAGNFFGRVYKSLAASGGTTWTNVSPPGAFTRIEIATAPTDAQKLYILCQGVSSNNCDAIFRSDDGGATWVSCPVPTIIDQGSNSNFTRGQAWYDLIAAVDPNDANTVVIGGVDALKSTDGGATWNQMTTWSLAGTGAAAFVKTVHADQHAIVFAPGSSSRAIWGTDGGVYLTDNANITITAATKPNFDPKNDGYNVTQFYSAAIHPTAGSNYFLAGAQDNGCRKFTDGTSGIQQTAQATGGDGAFCHIDQVDPTRQFSSYVYSVYYRSTNSGSSFSQVTSSQTRGSFINPTDYDPATQMLYGDATTVSTGVGGAFGRWTTTANTLSFITVTQFNSASVTFVLVSPVTAGRVYFGLNNGSIVYVDGANTGTGTKTGTIIKTGVGSVSGIAIEPGNENHMLVTYSNYGVTSVFESTNALNASPTWTSIEGNLPDMPVRWVIFKPGDYTKALLATELGVWTTDQINGSSTEWTPTNGGLANTRVDMLKVRASDNTVVAATHGRGLFTTTFTNTTLPTLNFKDRGTAVSETAVTSTSCGLGYRDVPVTLMLSNPVASDVTVSIDVDPLSTATLNQDYSLSATSVTIPAGSTQQSFNIRVLDDNNKELTESIVLNYTITSGGSLVTKGSTFQSYQLDITDDEVAPNGPYTAQYTSGPYNTNLGASSPLQSTQSDKKIQYLYRASELSAIGLKPGAITSFYFSVNSKASTIPYSGFTIKMANVSVTDLSAGFATASFTTVYSAPAGGFTPVMAENEFPVSGFTWDGTSNILFEYCYDNSAVGTADDVLNGESTSFSSQARKASTTTTDAGCSYTTGATVSTFRPVIVFSQTVAATNVATVVNTSKQAAIGPLETVNFFDASGNIVATVQNMDNWDYGCTTITIDRDGSTAQAFQDNNASNYVASKSVYFTPTNDNPTGNLRVTLYYTDAEKTGWETATGKSINNATLVKVKNAHISDVTPAAPHTSSVSIGVGPSVATLGTSYAVSATFSNGLSGFGLSSPDGSLPVTLLTFTGRPVNNHALLEWSTATETNSKRFDVERSANGVDFRKIGSVAAAGSSSSVRNYSFTDPEVLSGKQYYRLKQVDRDDRYAYSNIVWLTGKNAASFAVNPNPFSGYLDITLSEAMSGRTEAALYDANGRQVLKNTMELNGATTWRIYVNAHLSKGVYLLKITGNGKTSAVKLYKAD